MIDLKNQKIADKNGQIFTVQDISEKHSGGKIHRILSIQGSDGILKKYDYGTVFTRGVFTAVDQAIQKSIMEDIENLNTVSNKPRTAFQHLNMGIPKATQAHPTEDQLLPMHPYGGVAKSIYDFCCKKFGFDESKRGCFGKQKKLYAQNATKEGYAVWFLSNSNWTNTDNGVWKNTIEDDLELITQHSNDLKIEMASLGEIRVVFAKRNGQYLFLGIYQCTSSDNIKKTDIYMRITSKYPNT